MKEKIKDSLPIVFFVGLIFLIIAGSIGGCAMQNFATKEKVYTVTEKGIKNSKDKGLYLIYVKDEDGKTQTLCVKDTMWHWRWDSSDVYAKIEVGKTYRFKTCGLRIPFFSMYPNILEIEEVK